MLLLSSGELIVVASKYLRRSVAGGVQDGPQRPLLPGAQLRRVHEGHTGGLSWSLPSLDCLGA